MEIKQKPMGSFNKQKETEFIAKQMKKKSNPKASFNDMLKKEIDFIKQRRG